MNSIIQYLHTEPLVQAISMTLIQVLWKGGLLSIIMGVLLLALKKQESSLRYGLAMLSLFSILMLGIVEFSIQYNNARSFQVNTESNLRSDTIQSSSGKEVEAEYTTPPTNETLAAQSFKGILFLFWMLGLTFFAAKLLMGSIYSRRIRSHASLLIDDNLVSMLEIIKRQLKIKQGVRLVESLQISMPVVVGFIKPVIILPAGMIGQLSPDYVHAILAHEMAHIKRYDYLVNILQIIIETIFFFHPGVWYISYQVRKEREQCCDEMAIVSCNNMVLSKALLQVQELNINAPLTVLAFGGAKNTLLNRIKNIHMKNRKKASISDKLIASAVILISLIAISFTTANVSLPDKHSLSLKINHPEKIIQNLVDRFTPDPDTVTIHTEIDVEDNTIIRNFTDPVDQKNKELRIEIKKGEVDKLFVDGQAVKKDDYHLYQPIVDETLEELAKAEEEIKEAIKEVEEIDEDAIKEELARVEEELAAMDFEKIEADALKAIEEIDFEAMEAEIKAASEDIASLDKDVLLKEIQLAQEDILLAQQNLEMIEIDDIEMEQLQLQLEETFKTLEEMDFEIMLEEIELPDYDEILKEIEFDQQQLMEELEQARTEIEAMDFEKIADEMDFNKQEIIKELEIELKKIEDLELKDKQEK